MNTKAPPKTRTRNPTQTRAKLLQATIDLVAAKGADALSLKEAARVANVSRGVAYQHFNDREHLLREAKNWLTEKLLESLAGERSPESTEDRVYLAAKLVLNNREASRIFLADALAGEELRTDQPLYTLLIVSLQQFIASGKARPDMDIEMLSFIMFSAISAVIMLSYQHPGDVDHLARRFADEFTRFLHKGIFVEGVQLPAMSTPNAGAKA